MVLAYMKTWLDRSITTRELFFLLTLIFCFSPLISPPGALLLGLVFAHLIGHPFLHLNHKATHYMLQLSVVGLGFGMNLAGAWKAGSQGFLLTLFSIAVTLAGGFLLGRVFQTEKKASFLISAGTAICGGSAIAAISPVIQAEEKQISVALGTVFILNSVALFVFPILGHAWHLSQSQFGLWCAIAIHDTSSVVGAAGRYGPEALQVATVVKLARALWIIPVTVVSAFVFKRKASKVKIPYFIAWFVLAMVANTYIPFVGHYGHFLVDFSKGGLTVTLFLIGCGLNRRVLGSVGWKPFFQGVLLWILIGVSSLVTIRCFL